MIYFKDQSGKVYSYESQAERDQYGPPELVLMTPDEVDAHINPPPTPLTRDRVEALRLGAYADPLTGSDRYFAEAQRETLLGNADAAEAAKALGLARFAEIQAEYPWP